MQSLDGPRYSITKQLCCPSRSIRKAFLSRGGKNQTFSVLLCHVLQRMHASFEMVRINRLVTGSHSLLDGLLNHGSPAMRRFQVTGIFFWLLFLKCSLR